MRSNPHLRTVKASSTLAGLSAECKRFLRLNTRFQEVRLAISSAVIRSQSSQNHTPFASNLDLPQLSPWQTGT